METVEPRDSDDADTLSSGKSQKHINYEAALPAAAAEVE